MKILFLCLLPVLAYTHRDDLNDKVQLIETHRAPVILLHEHSNPDTRYLKENLSMLEESSVLNSFSTTIENPEMYKEYPKGSIYFPIANTP